MIITETNRIERILYLYITMRDGRAWTTKEAAQETGVSPRTIQRDFLLMSRISAIYSDNGLWQHIDTDNNHVEISPY